MNISRQKILVVDDEADILELIEYNLKKEGYQVFTAGNGQEAVTEARRTLPDLIILDLNLPVLSGLEVCRVLRSRSDARHLPIIMLTAKTSESDRVAGLELGADDYVTKPFSLRELTARIRAIFRRSEQAAATQAPPAVDLGRVQIDLAGHRVMRDGHPLPIKPKAFELLAVTPTVFRHRRESSQHKNTIQALQSVARTGGAQPAPDSVNTQQ